MGELNDLRMSIEGVEYTISADRGWSIESSEVRSLKQRIAELEALNSGNGHGYGKNLEKFKHDY
jgi:hypothetical protein